MSYIVLDYSGSVGHNSPAPKVEVWCAHYNGVRGRSGLKRVIPAQALNAYGFVNTPRTQPFGESPAGKSVQPHALWRELPALLLEQCNKIPVALAVYEFMKDLEVRGCTEATKAEYRATLYRLIHWCQDSRPPILLLLELNVRTLRAWLQTLQGASLTRHHEHERGELRV